MAISCSSVSGPCWVGWSHSDWHLFPRWRMHREIDLIWIWSRHLSAGLSKINWMGLVVCDEIFSSCFSKLCARQGLWSCGGWRGGHNSIRASEAPWKKQDCSKFDSLKAIKWRLHRFFFFWYRIIKKKRREYLYSLNIKGNFFFLDLSLKRAKSTCVFTAVTKLISYYTVRQVFLTPQKSQATIVFRNPFKAFSEGCIALLLLYTRFNSVGIAVCKKMTYCFFHVHSCILWARPCKKIKKL